jgi:tRNA threonylcarbamoyl adenosine modification protein YeaZ
VLLAIDSSAGTGAAVVDVARSVLAERVVADPLRHAEVVGELIAGVLADAGAAVGDLEAIAIGVGPGPFTGLRVGMAAGRTFALAAGIPALGVVSHDAIAAASGEGGDLVVTTDARRRELYWSRYAGLDADGIPVRVEGPALAKRDAVPGSAVRLDATTLSAGWLGLVAARTRRAGRSPVPIEPLYLRSPDVTLSAPKRVS